MSGGLVRGGLPGVDGRVALVTGAAQGIGASVVAALAGSGAIVAAVDLDADGLVDRAAALAGKGLAVHAFPADVRDTDQVELAVGRVEAEVGPIGILVNVAGILRTGAVVDLDDVDFHELVEVNIGGVLRCSRAVARNMRQRRDGVIVTVGSNAARVPRIGMGAYAATKAASAQLTLCLGLELAGYGIRCNVVAPGSTDTAMQRALWTDIAGEAAVIAGSPESFKNGIPLGRIAQPEDIAEAVLFLVSDHARHITLHQLTVDGGASLGA